MQVKHFISTSFQRFRDEQEGLTLTKGHYTIRFQLPLPTGWKMGKQVIKVGVFDCGKNINFKKIYILYTLE